MSTNIADQDSTSSSHIPQDQTRTKPPKNQQERLQQYLDSLPRSESEEKAVHPQPSAPFSSIRKEKRLEMSPLQKMTHKYNKEYESRLGWMTKAGNLEWELSEAKSAFKEQEQAIQDQDAEAKQHENEIERLKMKLNNEKKAANLGWRLLWNQKRRIEQLETQIAAAALLDLSTSDVASGEAARSDFLTKGVTEAAHEKEIQLRDERIGKLEMSLAKLEAEIRERWGTNR